MSFYSRSPCSMFNDCCRRASESDGRKGGVYSRLNAALRNLSRIDGFTGSQTGQFIYAFLHFRPIDRQRRYAGWIYNNRSGLIRMSSLKALTLWLVFLMPQSLPTRTSFATTIAVLKTQSEIVAGADSMGLFVTGKQRISYRFCKIHEVHDFFIASAGFYDTRAGQRLNINEIVRSVTKKGHALADVVNRSGSAIVSALSQVISEARKDDGLYNLLVRGNIVTFFFGFEDARPAAYVHRARITPREHSSTPSIESTQERCGPSCIPPDGQPYLMHTPSQAIDDFRAKNSGLLQDNPVAFVRNAILSDIAANQHRSGPPVDILRLDQNGPTWIDKKPSCP
jgi:hypothetical protein